MSPLPFMLDLVRSGAGALAPARDRSCWAHRPNHGSVEQTIGACNAPRDPSPQHSAGPFEGETLGEFLERKPLELRRVRSNLRFTEGPLRLEDYIKDGAFGEGIDVGQNQFQLTDLE